MPVFIFPNYDRYRNAGILNAGKIILCFCLQCFTRNAFYTKDRLDKCGVEGIILKMQDFQRGDLIQKAPFIVKSLLYFALFDRRWSADI